MVRVVSIHDPAGQAPGHGLIICLVVQGEEPVYPVDEVALGDVRVLQLLW